MARYHNPCFPGVSGAYGYGYSPWVLNLHTRYPCSCDSPQVFRREPDSTLLIGNRSFLGASRLGHTFDGNMRWSM